MNNQIISKSVVIILLMSFLTSCATTPSLSLEDGVSVAVEPTAVSNIDFEVTTKAMA